MSGSGGPSAGAAERVRVRYEKKDHVARVTLDRPDVLNALDLRTHEELAGVWDDDADNTPEGVFQHFFIVAYPVGSQPAYCYEAEGEVNE